MHSNYRKKEVVHLSKYPICWVNKLVVNVVSGKKLALFCIFVRINELMYQIVIICMKIVLCMI